jgi:hypothetical protein
MEQYWMDEQDVWSIRKQICITCKAQTSLGQSQNNSKIQLGGGLVVLNKDGAILDG